MIWPVTKHDKYEAAHVIALDWRCYVGQKERERIENKKRKSL